MKKYLESSKHFKKYTDPESGIMSYVLDSDSLPLTQSFYFTNPSATSDGRYVWFYCAFPPAADAGYGRTLGLFDLESDTVTHFPDTMFLDASPAVDVDDGSVYYCMPSGIWRRSPDPNGKPERISAVPKELRGRGKLLNLATHLSFSPDKARLFLDANVANSFIFGELDIKSGEYIPWCEFDYCMNHAQYNPQKENLILYAEDEWVDIMTSSFYKIRRDAEGRLMRLHLLEKGGEPIYIPPKYIEARHEWWSADGEKLYYVDWIHGTIRYDLRTGEYTEVDPRGTWHAHSSLDDKYLVADENEIDGEKWYRGCPSRVHFYNTETNRAVNIITENPAVFTRQNPSSYHIDPHPQFAVNDSVIIHTSTVIGKPSLTITPTNQLINATK